VAITAVAPIISWPLVGKPMPTQPSDAGMDTASLADVSAAFMLHFAIAGQLSQREWLDHHGGSVAAHVWKQW
jgi:hypothetical protein